MYPYWIDKTDMCSVFSWLTAILKYFTKPNETWLGVICPLLPWLNSTDGIINKSLQVWPSLQCINLKQESEAHTLSLKQES